MIISEHERYQQSQRATWIGAITNTGLAVLKMLTGTVGRSPALFADGLHSLSDLLCDALVLVAAYYGKAGADSNHPYGHRRIETIATLTLGIFLFFLGLTIFTDAMLRILHHHIVRPDTYTLWIALISVIANEWLFRYQLKIAKQVDSSLLSANAWHSRGDALSSIVVLIGIAGALAGWSFLDPLAAMVVAAIIIRMGVRWSWKALYELSDAASDPKLVHDIQTLIQTTDGVLHMHQLRTRQMADKIMLDVHIEIPPYRSASEGHYIAECVRIKLMHTFQNIGDVTVHVDIEDHPEGLPRNMLPSRAELWARLLPQWRLMVPETAITHMVLHYIHYQIHIELYLNLTGLTVDLAQLHQRFQDSIKTEPKVVKISLYTPIA